MSGSECSQAINRDLLSGCTHISFRMWAISHITFSTSLWNLSFENVGVRNIPRAIVLSKLNLQGLLT